MEYCLLFYLLSDVEVVFLPVTLLLMTAMVIAAEKGDYEGKLTWWQRSGILLGPWLGGGIFAIIQKCLLHPEKDDSSGKPQYFEGCPDSLTRNSIQGVNLASWQVVSSLFIVLVLAELLALLVLHCYMTRRQKQQSELSLSENSEMQPSVHSADKQLRHIVVVTILDISLIVVFIPIYFKVSINILFQYRFRR